MRSPTAAARHRYPAIRSGGLFAALVGVTTIVATLLGGGAGFQPGAFIIGYLLSVVVGLVIARRFLSYGDQSITQWIASLSAIALEAIALAVVGGVLGTGDPRRLALWILLTVALQLLVFVVVHGPLMGALAGLCIVNALAGLWLPDVSFMVFGLIDGALKIAFGIAMLLARPTLPPVEAGQPRQQLS